MVGERITHIRFGEGIVTAFAPPHIEIAFGDGAVKTFVYPQAVDRFIRFTDGKMQAQAQRDLEQAGVLARENEMARVLANQQRAAAAARQRLEQLHERKVAAARRTAARSAAARKAKATGGTTK